MTRWSSISSVT